MDNFGKRIKILRLKKGYTQGTLAQMLGVSPSAVGMLERGQRSPSPQMIIKLSRIFSVSTDYLLGVVNAPESVEELLKQIFDSVEVYGGLTFNGVSLGKADTKKLFYSFNIAANVILDERMRSVE